MEHIKADLCVIGGGSGGLSVAAGASQLGAKVVLFESERMGGDCLHRGCVPSKTFLAIAKALSTTPDPLDVRYARARARIADVIASIAPHDSVERFEGLGVRVVQARARFQDVRTVVGGDVQVRARRVVIATGSRPRLPDISGLERVPFWTTDTLWTATTCPLSLVILGGGPIGFEMAQAFAWLGVQVTLIEPHRLMGRDDPDLVNALRQSLEQDGVRFVLGQHVTAVDADSQGGVAVHLADGNRLCGEQLLLATGREPNVDGLNLKAAGIAVGPRGIVTDRRLRTSQKRVFAIGDVAGREAFTHAASAHASVVVKQALFGLPARIDTQVMSWVTFTDPELAHVGMTADARDMQVPRAKQRVLEMPFAELDRARCEGQSEGRMRVVTDSRGRILSVDVLGPKAGELILPWVLAIDQGISLSRLASTVVPYPTRSEITKRIAGSYFTRALFSARTRALVSWIQRLLP